MVVTAVDSVPLIGVDSVAVAGRELQVYCPQNGEIVITLCSEAMQCSVH